MKLRSVAFVLAVVAVVPASADAASWSAPQAVATVSPLAFSPALAFTGGGRALAWWRDGLGHSPTESVATAPPAGAFGASSAAPLSQLPPQLYAGAGTLTVGRGHATLGSLGSTRTKRLATGLGAARPGFGVDPRTGTAVLAAITGQERAGGHGQVRAVRLTVRKAGGRFAPPAIVRTGAGLGSVVAAATGHHGDLLVAYERSGRIEVRLRRAPGKLGPVQDLGPVTDASLTLRAAIAPSGAAALAWGTSEGDEGARTLTVSAAVLKAGDRHFGPATALATDAPQPDPASETNLAPPHLALAPNGTAAVAFVSTGQVEVATSDGTGFGAPVAVSPPGVSTSAVAAGPDGSVTAVWSAGGAIGAAVRPAGVAAFDPPETVFSGDQVYSVAAAVDPLTSQPAVLWVSVAPIVFPGPGGIPLPQTTTVAFARRTA